jgi:hypothetical protein
MDLRAEIAELPEFANNPHAYVKLWKHHAAQPQADRINQLAATRKETWLSRYGLKGGPTLSPGSAAPAREPGNRPFPTGANARTCSSVSNLVIVHYW